MKKLFLIFTSFLLVICTSFTLVYAKPSCCSQDNKNETGNQFNEYLVLKQMHEKLFDSDGQLLQDKQYSEELLDTVKNYRRNYIRYIEKMKGKSNEQLENLNYTKPQIYAIRNFDYSEEMLIAASSYVDVYGGFNSFSHSSSYSSASVVMAFNWYGSPMYWFQDIFAVTWTDFNVGAASATISLKPVGTGSSFSQNTTIYASGTHSDYIKFNKRYGTTHTLSAGSIIYGFYANHNVTDPVVFAAYGYNTINITPSVSFGGSTPATLGISFGSYMITADSARVYP